jgi:hypothetical protein
MDILLTPALLAYLLLPPGNQQMAECPSLIPEIAIRCEAQPFTTEALKEDRIILPETAPIPSPRPER